MSSGHPRRGIWRTEDANNRVPSMTRVMTICNIFGYLTLSVEGLAIMGLIIVLLVVWLAFVIVGFAVKALLWLAIVGIVLFVATGIYGAIRSRTS